MFSIIYPRFLYWTFVASKMSVKLTLMVILAPRLVSTLRLTYVTPKLLTWNLKPLSKSLGPFFQASILFLRSRTQGWVKEAWGTLLPRPDQTPVRPLYKPLLKKKSPPNTRNTTPVSAIRIELFLQKNLQRVITNRNQKTSSTLGLQTPQKMKFIDAPFTSTSQLNLAHKKTDLFHSSIMVTATA
ncbi:hypothetical protein K7432_006971 [Basidiobolus ranarum]|uniref:Uncharacterized protein n=1 Tax=Basidiobolus ranarum TaxID=34480 RepID=A0ABR2W116_9FUNG